MFESNFILVQIFSLSFLVALTGAMAPGPLLTYTIIESSAVPRGYLMAFPIIAGHALIELGIMILLFAGFSFIFTDKMVIRAIGVAGGAVLAGFGIMVILDIIQKRAKISDTSLGGRTSSSGMLKISGPVLGGALVSMSNPYWWVWWATVGLAFMANFGVTPSFPGRIAAFYIGHELGDLFWYLIVSVLSFYGIRRLTPGVYHAILACCGFFMIAFGIYLGLKPFLHP